MGRRFQRLSTSTLLLLLILVCIGGGGAASVVPEPRSAPPGAPKTAAEISFDRATIVKARKDLPAIYESGCYASYQSAKVPRCVFNNPAAPYSVFLVGDSHAVQWAAALREITERYGWRLTVVGKRGCSFSVNEQTDNHGKKYPSCEEWNERVSARILRDQPDLVVTSNFSLHKVMSRGKTLGNRTGEGGEPVLAAGLARAWGPLLDAGIPVTVIRDTPFPGIHVPNCLLKHPGAPEQCGVTKRIALDELPTPDLLAARLLPEVDVIDFTDEICPDGNVCPATIGESIVWRDKHHLTSTFSTGLANTLEAQLRALPHVAPHMWSLQTVTLDTTRPGRLIPGATPTGGGI